MRENRTSGSMRGCRKRATSWRACALLYACPLAEYEAAPHARPQARCSPELPATFSSDCHAFCFPRGFLPLGCWIPRLVAMLPSALSWQLFGCGAHGCSQFLGCCYLKLDLREPRRVPSILGRHAVTPTRRFFPSQQKQSLRPPVSLLAPASFPGPCGYGADRRLLR